ncbi:DUF3800 domain-containing protein [Methylocystis sp.]|uniref:DUF3800 domain-containing protein n=1 Tax=Methylocystis sp. TaxID=1911079 RepID=UPI003DA44A91
MIGYSIANRVLLPMAFRLYIDEMGNGDLKGAANDPNIRYLSLTGILTRTDLHNRQIQPVLDEIKHRRFGHTPDNPVIFHRREIMRAEGKFGILADPKIREGFNCDLLNALEKLPYLVITVQIDKKAHLDTYGVWHYDPYHYCLRCIVERYVLYLKNHNFVGDVLIEARNPKSDKKLKASFAKIYCDGTQHLPARLIQTVLISKDIKLKPKSSNIAGLQIADLLAHPSARHMRFEREGIEHPRDFGTKIANLLIAKKYRRDPQTLKIEGYGTKWLP